MGFFDFQLSGQLCRKSTVAAAMLVSPVVCTTASAQSWDVMTPQLNTIESHRMINQIIENNAGSQRDAPVLRPGSQADAATLDFAPSRARREASLARLVNAMRSRDPSGAASLEQLFASTDIVAAIGREIAPSGLKTTNLADAFALWWITAWDGAQGTTRTPSRPMAQAVRRQAMTAMLATPDAASMTDADKQAMAEAYLIQAGLIAASVEQVAGDATALDAVKRAVAKSAKASGMDLTQVTLTEEGFVPATRKTSANDAAQDATPDAIATDKASSVSPLLYAGAGAGVAALIFWAARARG